MMKMSKGIWSVILLVLIAVSPLFVVNAGPSNATLQVENEEGFKVISNGMITVAFPENGTKPMFFWWSGEKNSRYIFDEISKSRGVMDFTRPIQA